jgi:Skp family chaperone for outer membrane proteins
MHRRFALLTVFTLLLASLAIPASAKQPADVASLVDAALSARLHAASQAQAALNAAPGQSSTKIAERQARVAAKVAKFAAKVTDDKGSDRSMAVHAILAAGKCNPGQGEGQKLGHMREGHRWFACKTVTTLGVYSGPPGHDPAKVKGDDKDD